MSLFLVHRNRALVADLTQLREHNVRLASVQAENAELRAFASREQAVAGELETLRQQAREVHRLRARGSELLRLRDENQALALRFVELTNALAELAQQNEQLQQSVRTSRSAFGITEGDTVPMQVPIAYEFDNSFRQYFGEKGAAEVERAWEILRNPIVLNRAPKSEEADSGSPMDLLRLDGR